MVRDSQLVTALQPVLSPKIRIANTLRATRPVELQDPMVAFSIFSAIALTHAAQFATVTDGLAFIRQLFLAFLFGFSIATGVALLVLPITNRRNIFKGVLNYVEGVDKILGLEQAFIQSVQQCSLVEDESGRKIGQPIAPDERAKTSNEACETLSVDNATTALKSSMAALIALHDRIAGDLRYAKFEIAWGRLDPKDLESIFALLRSLLVPLAGLTLLPDILDRAQDWDQLAETRPPTQHKWNFLLGPLKEDLAKVTDLAMKGLQHSLLVLRIASNKKLVALPLSTNKAVDAESSITPLVPGDDDFCSYFEQIVSDFYRRRQKNIAWPSGSSHSEATGLSEDELTKLADPVEPISMETTFISLYMEHLMDTLLQSILNFVTFADSKVADKSISQNRLIFPHIQFLVTALSLGPRHEAGSEDDEENGSSERASDPEHLLPANAWERGSGSFRTLSRFLSSDQSKFGFRAAAASFTVAVLAYLHQTQDFFYKQRLIWVLIVINIGMTPTSGASLFSFAGRIIATAVSLALGLAAWYIVVGHTAGVLVFLFFANAFEVRLYPRTSRFY